MFVKISTTVMPSSPVTGFSRIFDEDGTAGVRANRESHAERGPARPSAAPVHRKCGRTGNWHGFFGAIWHHPPIIRSSPGRVRSGRPQGDHPGRPVGTDRRPDRRDHGRHRRPVRAGCVRRIDDGEPGKTRQGSRWCVREDPPALASEPRQLTPRALAGFIPSTHSLVSMRWILSRETLRSSSSTL
jgi:hypothetical protein